MIGSLNRSSLLLASLALGMLPGMAGAADLSAYREFKLGARFEEIRSRSGIESVSVVQTRPGLIQEMEWRPARSSYATDPALNTGSAKAQGDPVINGTLSFFNGELYRMAINYDRYRVRGLTEADMVDGISTVYGPATHPGGEIPYRSSYASVSAKVVARWENELYSYNLVQTGYSQAYTLVLYSKRVDALAEAARSSAAALDAAEAPQRALAIQAQREQAAQAALEQDRVENKVHFRP